MKIKKVKVVKDEVQTPRALYAEFFNKIKFGKGKIHNGLLQYLAHGDGGLVADSNEKLEKMCKRVWKKWAHTDIGMNLLFSEKFCVTSHYVLLFMHDIHREPTQIGIEAAVMLEKAEYHMRNLIINKVYRDNRSQAERANAFVKEYGKEPEEILKDIVTAIKVSFDV